MSAFNRQPAKTITASVTKVENSEKKISEFYINLGFRKVYGEGDDAVERFVNIPLFITADNIDQGIERVRKNCSKNSPEEWLEFIEDQIMLGEDIKTLFAEIPEGNNAVNKDIPEDHDLAYLADLEVQFVHKDMHKEDVVTSPKDASERRKGFKRS